MNRTEDDCIWVRAEAWLISGSGTMLKVETRKICRGGVFLEASWPAEYQAVEIIFPDPAAPDGGHRVAGSVTERWPDGIWVEFHRALRSPSEMLMRSGITSSGYPALPPEPSVWASW
ncbi:MAG: hypothetical protein KFF45_02090 [Thioalkalivibrio sp.]|nr:hypothetical protein [Thioalkalivibrio sp.]